MNEAANLLSLKKHRPKSLWLQFQTEDSTKDSHSTYFPNSIEKQTSGAICVIQPTTDPQQGVRHTTTASLVGPFELSCLSYKDLHVWFLSS